MVAEVITSVSNDKPATEVTYLRIAWTRAGWVPTAAPVELFKNWEIASLFGASNVMLVRLANCSWYGWSKFVKFDSCGLAPRTAVRDMLELLVLLSCPKAAVAKANARIAVFILSSTRVSNSVRGSNATER